MQPLKPFFAGWLLVAVVALQAAAQNKEPGAPEGIQSEQSEADTQDTRPNAGENADPAGETSEQTSQDGRSRELVVGVWRDDYQGKRTMTLRKDGTGVMLVELQGLKARLFAPRLQFDMTWSIEQGRLKKKTVSGEPALQVQMILKTLGDRVDEPILELTEKRLLLLDQDGETKYDWRRVR